MYKYRHSADESPQRPASPRSRNLNSSIPKPVVERPMSASYKASQGVSQKDKTLSEKYTNRTYNRLPSPKARFQTFVKTVSTRQPFAEETPSTNKDEHSRAIDRPQPPKPHPRTVVKNHSYSDIIGKRRPLDLECNTQEEEEVRPRTSNWTRTESRLEHKVLHTVKHVLSRALMQQGRIDESDLGHIIESMRDSLNLEDEESPEIDIELKPSRTTVNEVNVVEERPVERKSKPIAGIVRRDNPGTVPERKPYRKIYDQVDSFSNKNIPVGDEQEYVYVDIPDSVFNNFASSRKSDVKTRPPRNTASKKSIQEETTKRDEILKQHEVGDSQTKDNHFWNPSEDAKLREYIESLIYNMKTQVQGCDSRMTEVGGEIDSHGTICRSFCVCKVCISKNNQPKLVLKQNPSEVEAPVPACGEPKINGASEQKPIANEGMKPPVQRPLIAQNRLRLVKTPSVKSKETNPSCKVIRRTNPNFNPESSLNTSLDKKTSYTVAETGTVPEESDDLYLQRRIRKAPSRVTSKRIS